MKRAASRSGQIVLVLVFLIMGLAFLFLMEVDIFAAARGKMRLENAGDAAALAAARWQGVTLNLIGELNLVHLAAACETNRAAEAGIAALQERLAIAGPCMALLAANETARENLEKITPADSPARAEMAAMARIVDYVARAAEGRASPSWPTQGADHADMLRTAAADGCWAGADNAQILPAATVNGSHPLYTKAFYQAAAGQNWPRICLNVFDGQHGKAVSTLLNWPGWGTVPEATWSNSVENAEFFGVGVSRGTFTLDAATDGAYLNALVDAAREAGLDDLVTPDALVRSEALSAPAYPWYFFAHDHPWRPWHEVNRGGSTHFPLRSDVKSEYDVLGAAAACRVAGALVPVSDLATTNLFVWTAAAKPFGTWRNERIIDALKPWNGTFNDALVLPGFTCTRLIPLGGVGEGSLGAADETWLTHVREHVPFGIRRPGCSYCSILDRWDDPAYTHAGGLYLQNHAHNEVCAPPPDGEGSGGGTRHAH